VPSPVPPPIRPAYLPYPTVRARSIPIRIGLSESLVIECGLPPHHHVRLIAVHARTTTVMSRWGSSAAHPIIAIRPGPIASPPPSSASSASFSSSSSDSGAGLAAPAHALIPGHPPSTRLGQAGPPLSRVNFCAIQIELDSPAPELSPDISYNRGKSLEDVFDTLTLRPPHDPEVGLARARRARGRRSHSTLTITTFRNWDSTMSVSREASTSKESSPPDDGPDASLCLGASVASAVASSVSRAASVVSSAETGEDVLKFVSGNPFVEVTKGVIHLYKENQATSLEDGVIRSPMLCILGVPSKIKTLDLLQFTAPSREDLEMMRIIQDGSPNQYMVLLRFKCQEPADEFFQAFNGARFNSIEEDVCSLVYVSKVETCRESEYYPAIQSSSCLMMMIIIIIIIVPALEMDESISTVLTILCNHTFHGSCLAQWSDSTCPVCRYIQTPNRVEEEICSECQSSDDLWMCLVCGYVGCGRYVGGHSHAHFKDTGHNYTLELGQNRVWDYVGDNFVHRLVQTDGCDGKFVEAQEGPHAHEGKQSSGKTVDGVSVNSDEKMDSIQLEYTYLLTSQLEAQRRYYEEKISRMEESASQEMEEVVSRARKSVEESKQMEVKLLVLSKEKAKSDQKLAQMNSKFQKLHLELQEEKQMNESLRRNQGEYQKRVDRFENQLLDVKTAKDAEVKELQEQMRDLMFYMEAQQKIAQSPMRDEIQNGDVSVGSNDAAETFTGAVRKSQKKRKGK
ncbi:hypothetical protein TCAL_09740, partial [Tigriopus californicus]